MIALQPTHILIIILIALLLFLPSRLPQLARGFKAMFSQFRKEASGKKETSNTGSETLKNEKR